ncbi:MAG: ribose-phosphate diphosphokinase [Gammaproteobacteria bacterium]|nr:ribose-phosphate diphosphokinase [Gammaproteobacteria bacterium]
MTITVNQKIIHSFNFPGGECHVQISSIEITEQTDILTYINNANDIMTLLLTVDAIRRINRKTDIYLTIPYFPYSRQDRVCNPGEALSVKVMADIINSLNCTLITIYDPHSDVTPALINNCKIITLAEIVSKSFLADEICNKNMTLVSPDAGSEKKIQVVAKKISESGKTVNVLYASKIRDTLTGKIISTEVRDELHGKDFIILDDICDGGGTFIELSKALKNLGAENIYLYVTHGIFSKGLDVLRENFKHIYCCHTFLKAEQIDRQFLTVIGVTQ